jgi:hypothetical protein
LAVKRDRQFILARRACFVASALSAIAVEGAAEEPGCPERAAPGSEGETQAHELRASARVEAASGDESCLE